MWSEQVYAARVSLNLSQPEFAEMLGVSTRTIIRWEMGHTAVSEWQLQRIADMSRQTMTMAVHPQGEPPRTCAVEGCARPVAVDRRKYCSKRCATQKRAAGGC